MITYLIAADNYVASEADLRDWSGLPETANIEEVLEFLESELRTTIIPQEEE